MKKFLTMFLATIMLVALAACGSDEGKNADSNPEKLVMGFVPSQDSDEIADTVKPLADKLSEKLGIEVEGQVMTSYNALIEAMGANEVHIGFIPAFGYILANEQYDVEVILKSIRYGSDTYRAQYIVRADSGITSLADLEGKIWAYGDATSTSGFLFPASQLMEEFGIESAQALQTEFFAESIQTGGHDNSAIAVYEGDADVATTFDDVRTSLEEEYPDMMEKTTVIEYTADIPNDTISVTKQLDDELVEKIEKAFLSFNEDETMMEVMKEVYSWDGIAVASHDEYKVVGDTYKKFKDSITID